MKRMQRILIPNFISFNVIFTELFGRKSLTYNIIWWNLHENILRNYLEHLISIVHILHIFPTIKRRICFLGHSRFTLAHKTTKYIFPFISQPVIGFCLYLKFLYFLFVYIYQVYTFYTGTIIFYTNHTHKKKKYMYIYLSIYRSRRRQFLANYKETMFSTIYQYISTLFFFQIR